MINLLSRFIESGSVVNKKHGHPVTNKATKISILEDVAPDPTSSS